MNRFFFIIFFGHFSNPIKTPKQINFYYKNQIFLFLFSDSIRLYVMVVFRIIHDVTSKYKIIRGVIAYAILWPIGCLMQQTLIEKKTFKDYDWHKCIRWNQFYCENFLSEFYVIFIIFTLLLYRYGLYGALFNGPTLYLWIRVASNMWPRSDIRSSLAKAITEQIAYDPFAISIFLYSMGRSEGKTREEAWHEVTEKFWPTYQVGFIYWPIVQTVNFSVVPQKNQVIVAGFFSLFWTTFLACVKHLEVETPPPSVVRAQKKLMESGQATQGVVKKN